MAYYVLNDSDFQELNELYSTSLGVTQKDSGTAMNPNARTMVIGLGGMGLATVYELKKSLEARIGKIPDTSTEIKFMAIDTDITDINQKRGTGVLSVKETFHLYNEKLGNEITKSLQESTRMLVPPAIETVLPAPHIGFNPMLEGNGAGQIRLAGKLSLMEADKFTDLYKRIKDAIAGLNNFTSRNLEVHIVAGIGGGSGSGLVIDLPYLVRKILADLGVRDNRIRIFGHIYLPNIYDNGEVANLTNAYKNGYAALKEIDYYMNLDQIGEAYNTIFPSIGAYSSQSKIFSRCTLVGGKLSTAIIVENTKKAAIDCCVAGLINQVTSAQTKEKDTSGQRSSMADIFTSAGFLDNVSTAVETMVKKGVANFNRSPAGSYHYACIGSASLRFPTNAIIECFVGEVYAKMLEQMKRNADSITQKDADKFADGLISPDDLLKSPLGRFSSDIENIFQEEKWDRKSVLSTAELEKSLDTKIAKIMSEFDKDGQLISKAIASANNKASEIFKDTARGPLYLAKLLTSGAHGGGKFIGYYEMLDSYAAKISDRKSNAETAYETLRQKKRELADDMQKLLGFGSKLPKFLEAFKDMYVKKLEVALCERLARDYYFPCERRIGACYSMKKSLDNNYLCFVDIITRIGEILVENVKVGKSELSASSSDASNILALTIDSCLDPLKNSVAHKLETRKNSLDDPTIAAFADAYFNAILTDRDQWSMTDPGTRTYGASKCAAAFRSFIKSYEPFDDIISQSFSSYFDEAYRNDSEVEKTKVVHTLVEYLRTHSAPMFNIWQDFSWADIKELCYQYMIIPNNMGDYWGAKFKDCIEFNGMTNNIFESPDQSTIYNYTLYAGLPMWIHADICKYEKAYYTNFSTGVHINESPKFQPTYKEYPAIMPREQWFHATEGNIHYTNDYETAVENDVHSLVDFALENGIILYESTTTKVADNNAYADPFANPFADPFAAPNTVAQTADVHYYARVVANKPNIYSNEFKQFVRKYCEDTRNIGENGLVSGGIKLYEAMLKEFGETKETITPLGPKGGLRPDKVENLYVLIRHQMQLVKKLRLERAYLTVQNGAFSLIDEYNKEAIGRKQRADYFKFLLYGLISADERGIWSYRLVDKLYTITSKLQVAEKNVEMVRYMEIAVLDAFYAMENINAHATLLNQNVSQINASINNGTYDRNLILENYKKYTDLADEKLNEFVTKVSRGESLTPKDIEVKEFYESLKVIFESVRELL